MNSGSFDGGLLNLTSWVGNAVMPIFAALILAMGIYKYSRGYRSMPLGTATGFKCSPGAHFGVSRRPCYWQHLVRNYKRTQEHGRSYGTA
jgi:hypothetical protein